MLDAFILFIVASVAMATFCTEVLIMMSLIILIKQASNADNAAHANENA
jgi:hypothetical protein